MPDFTNGDPVALTIDPADVGLPDSPGLVYRRHVEPHSAVVQGDTFGSDRTDYVVPSDSLRLDVGSLTDTQRAVYRILDRATEWMSVEEIRSQITHYLPDGRGWRAVYRAASYLEDRGVAERQKRPSGKRGADPSVYRLER